MPGSPTGKASTFTTFGVRSLRSGWATRMAIQPPKSILLGSHSSTHLISRVPLWTRLPPWRDFSCAAISHVLRLLFGSDVLNFQMTTTNPNAAQKTRTFTRLSQAEKEVINARVYVGIRYRNSDRTARVQGLRVFKNYFRPVGDLRFWAQQEGVQE